MSYLNKGEVGNALAGLVADLARHEATKHRVTDLNNVSVTYYGALEFIKSI